MRLESIVWSRPHFIVPETRSIVTRSEKSIQHRTSTFCTELWVINVVSTGATELAHVGLSPAAVISKFNFPLTPLGVAHVT